MEAQFNSRLQISRYEVPGVLGLEYQYTTTSSPNNDGRIKFARDLVQTNSKFDRAYSYDHLGRLSTATSGTEARGGTVPDGPYNQTYSYDPFSNSTGRTNRLWADQFDDTSTVDPATNRKVGWTYDADGRVTGAEQRTLTYDAGGRMTKLVDRVRRLHGFVNRTQQRGYDGNGLRVKEDQNGTVTYQIRSSVMGNQIITQLNANGQKQSSNVYLGSQVIAKQENNEVVWQHATPFDINEWKTTASGALSERVELDPVRADVGLQPPEDPGMEVPEPVFSPFADATQFSGGILLDGAEVPMVFIRLILNFGNGGAAIRDGLPGAGSSAGDWFSLMLISVKVDDPETYGTDPNTGAINIYEHYHYETQIISVPSAGISLRLLPQNTGVRGQLTGDRLNAYNNARAGALAALKNNADCKKFLLENFGLSASRVARAVRGQRAFDGLTSTINAADAGLVTHSDPRAGYQVKDLFTPTGKGIIGALQAGYASREDRGATQRDIYFGYYGFEASTIIHETLHSFTGLDDDALDAKAGGSGNLSVELERHGCK